MTHSTGVNGKFLNTSDTHQELTNTKITPYGLSTYITICSKILGEPDY